MPLIFVRNDITKMHCDAIVNAANNTLLGGLGVDGAIHAAAGPELLAECRTLGGCETGKAKITKGYRLPARYVIHTVGPVWQDGSHGEPALLRACYRESLRLAEAHGLGSIAFPLISAGAYGYPKEQALQVAVEAIRDYLARMEDAALTVYLVVFDRRSFRLSASLADQIAEYIDDTYALAHETRASLSRPEVLAARAAAEKQAVKPLPQGRKAARSAPQADGCAAAPMLWGADELGQAVSQLDESFSEMLLRKIDERGMKDADCYKKANVDRKLFSKIRKDAHYHPSKQTALAFAIALELDPAETRQLLEKAGFALSHSNKADVIVEFFLQRGSYNIFEINEALFAYDQPLLGGL